MTLIPCKSFNEEKPVCFDITFTHNKRKYQYRLAFCLGLFLQKNKNRYISLEQLFINDNLIYERTNKNIKTLNTSKIKDLLNIGYDSSDDNKTKEMMSRMRPPSTELGIISLRRGAMVFRRVFATIMAANR